MISSHRAPPVTPGGPGTALQVRQQIAEHLHALTGLTTTEVDITVVDVRRG